MVVCENTDGLHKVMWQTPQAPSCSCRPIKRQFISRMRLVLKQEYLTNQSTNWTPTEVWDSEKVYFIDHELVLVMIEEPSML